MAAPRSCFPAAVPTPGTGSRALLQQVVLPMPLPWLCAPPQITGRSDPYAMISVGPCAVRSSVKNNTLTPEWKEVFVLYVADIEKDVLKVGPAGCAVQRPLEHLTITYGIRYQVKMRCQETPDHKMSRGSKGTTCT